MSKQIAFVTVAILAGLGLAAVVVLMIVKPDAAETLGDYLIQLLILIGGFGGLAAQQAKQQEEIATIKKNTNGTLSAKEEQIAALRAIAAEHAPRALHQLDTSTDSIPVQSAPAE